MADRGLRQTLVDVDLLYNTYDLLKQLRGNRRNKNIPTIKNEVL